MREAVEERAGEPLGTEHGRPLIERQIARDQDGTALIALAEHLDQEFGAGLGQGYEPQLIADQQELISRYQREAKDAPAGARTVVFGFLAYPEPGPMPGSFRPMPCS